jgi:hypothetical protein
VNVNWFTFSFGKKVVVVPRFLDQARQELPLAWLVARFPGPVSDSLDAAAFEDLGERRLAGADAPVDIEAA